MLKKMFSLSLSLWICFKLLYPIKQSLELHYFYALEDTPYLFQCKTYIPYSSWNLIPGTIISTQLNIRSMEDSSYWEDF